jgi:hypothetical protein
LSAPDALRLAAGGLIYSPLRLLVWCWPRSSPSGDSYLVQKCESKSWALPAAATNRKTKIPPAPREFLTQRYFWHGLLRDQGVGPVQHHHPLAILEPRGLSAVVPRPLYARDSSKVRHGETPKPRMPLGEVPITSEQMPAPKAGQGTAPSRRTGATLLTHVRV